MDRVIGGRFRLVRRIGAGNFGEIYEGENLNSRRLVAVKLEAVHCRVPQLLYEAKLYRIFSGGTGIPRLFWHATNDVHNVMVIELLGKSLEDLFVRCRRHFSLKTVLMLADQMMSCVEFIHKKNFIHRDIKPDNFMMGLGSTSNQVLIIDYGLAKRYRDQHTHVHIPYIDGKSLTGTARYASVAALRGAEQSRRDDMEALGYVWLYLLRGGLPWMGVTGRNQKQKHERICEVKSQTSFEVLCRGYPSEFVRYFKEIRSLKFTDKPNYAEYREMFRDLFLRCGYTYDYKYDWVAPAQPPVQVPLQISAQPPKQVRQLQSALHPSPYRQTSRVRLQRDSDPDLILNSARPTGAPQPPKTQERYIRSARRNRAPIQDPAAVTPRSPVREVSARRVLLPAWMMQTQHVRFERGGPAFE
jgi:serine/threonine protein kinase